MIELPGLSTVRMNRSNIAALLPITSYASICQVGLGGISTMFPANDVVYLAGKPGITLVKETVFATVTSALGYFLSERLADITGHKRGSGGLSPSPSLKCAPVPESGLVPPSLR